MHSLKLDEANKPNYDTNYDTWLANQITSLQQGQWHELDIPHLIEELEQLNKSNERELESYLIVLLTHLLKWEFQPTHRSHSWLGSIQFSRDRIAKLFKHQKSLKHRVEEFIPDAYKSALKVANKETQIKIHLFPQKCLYSKDQLLDEDWLPSDHS